MSFRPERGRYDSTFINMEMTGIEEFEAALDFLYAAVSEKAVEDSLVEVMEPVAEDAAVRARRSDSPSKGEGIGHMADSIQVYRLGFMYGGLTVAVTFDMDHYWGNFLEMGTPHMAPWPFLRPAWEYLGDSRPAAFNRALGGRLETLVPGFHASGVG